MFTARYGMMPYIKQIAFRLQKVKAPFTIGDSEYGSKFFVATGFHGLLVITGTTSLITCLLRQTTLHFSSNQHFGFEAGASYEHFVDVVRLFL
jgi:cytochrome c oxidase subunit 3